MYGVGSMTRIKQPNAHQNNVHVITKTSTRLDGVDW